MTAKPQTIGAKENSGMRREAAAPLDAVEDDVEPELDEEAVTLAAPEPAVAVLVLGVPAFCEPCLLLPWRPGPVPAPWFMYLTAPAGIAGSESPSTIQVLDLGGQLLGEPDDLYPPSPEGLGVFLNADCNAAKSGRSVTEPPLRDTTP